MSRQSYSTVKNKFGFPKQTFCNVILLSVTILSTESMNISSILFIGSLAPKMDRSLVSKETEGRVHPYH